MSQVYQYLFWTMKHLSCFLHHIIDCFKEIILRIIYFKNFVLVHKDIAKKEKSRAIQYFLDPPCFLSEHDTALTDVSFGEQISNIVSTLWRMIISIILLRTVSISAHIMHIIRRLLFHERTAGGIRTFPLPLFGSPPYSLHTISLSLFLSTRSFSWYCNLETANSLTSLVCTGRSILPACSTPSKLDFFFFFSLFLFFFFLIPLCVFLLARQFRWKAY